MNFKRPITNIILGASILVLAFYLLRFAGIVYEPLGPLTVKLVNADHAFSLTKGESFIEWIEALFWLIAFALYLTLFAFRIRSQKRDAACSWLLFLALLCFVAFGEETSWGQQILGFDPPDYIKQINKQREINVHNLQLWFTFPSMIGLSRDSVAYSLLKKYLHYLPQFGFYMVCCILWIAMPIVKSNGTRFQSRALRTFPRYSRGIAVFLTVNIVAFAIVDSLFFDVGEVFELAVSATALISALDIFASDALAFSIEDPFEPVVHDRCSVRSAAASETDL